MGYLKTILTFFVFLCLFFGLPQLAHAGAVPKGASPWPKGIVYYHLDPALGGPKSKAIRECGPKDPPKANPSLIKVCRAMREWTKATGVQFVMTKTMRLDSLYIRHGANGSGTYATLGHQFTGNIIQVEPKASYGSVLHEFGHTLGLMHEHQRPDRDQYLSLEPFLKEAIKSCTMMHIALCYDVQTAFTNRQAVAISSPYDPCSLMHYLSNQSQRHKGDKRWSKIFALNEKGQEVFKTCVLQFKSMRAICHKIGQKCAISQSDAQLVRRFHGLTNAT